MKFGRQYTIYVQTEAQRLLPECPYVEFKRFKKLLKKCPHVTAPVDVSAGRATSSSIQEGVTITECDTELEDSNVVNENSSSVAVGNAQVTSNSSCPVCDANFFPDLDKAVSAVVGCFNARAKDLLRLHMASGLRKYLVRLRSKLAGDRRTMIQVGNTLVSYGCMNALAVRKILKKYDKIHSSEVGRAFKSRLQVRRAELLQSPLLIELGALAVNLMDSQVPYGLPQPQALGHYSTCNFDDDKQTITCLLPDELRLDFDLMCSICLEVVFDPVALGCGHIFCNSCACTAASIPVFLGATSAKRSKKCPLCRQAGVYVHAVQMGELHILVNKRCSSYYADRLPAEREQRVQEAKEHWERQTAIFFS